MNSRDAGIAGLLYLVVVLAGMTSLAYVPGQVMVEGDIAATIARIADDSALYRLGIAAGFICYAAFLLLPLALFRWLAPVSRSVATVMVALAVAGVPLSFVALSHRLDILSLATIGSRHFDAAQLQAQVALAIDAQRNAFLAAKLFWGLWLLPFGYLVFRCGFLPRVLGVLLMLGCCSYLVDVFGNLLYAGYRQTTLAGYATMPAALGEIGICLWLLAVGLRGVVRRDVGSVAAGARRR